MFVNDLTGQGSPLSKTGSLASGNISLAIWFCASRSICASTHCRVSAKRI